MMENRGISAIFSKILDLQVRFVFLGLARVPNGRILELNLLPNMVMKLSQEPAIFMNPEFGGVGGFVETSFILRLMS